MTIKYLILQTNFNPELGKSQQIKILLSSKNELPTASSIVKTKDNLWQNLELGNTFYENDNAKSVFANLPRKSIETLSQNWKLIPFTDLKPENCPDYDIIVAGIKKAGYSLN